MAFLVPDKIRDDHGLIIKEKLIPDGSRLKPNRKLSGGTGKVQWVTIHNTPDINEMSGTNDAEQYARATYNNAMGGVSVHYYIDETDCWQLLREYEVGYHAADGYSGPGNNKSLAIEIIMDGSGRDYDKAAEDRGAKLAAILLNRHGLGIDRLTTHNRWYGKKYCPAFILPHWSSFQAKVQNYLNEIEAEGKTDPKPLPAQKMYYVQIGSYAVKKNADNAEKTARALGLNTTVKTAKIALKTVYRVQIGAFSVKANAEAYAEEARKKGLNAVVME